MSYDPQAWAIIITRGGMEARAIEALAENGVDAYCPMETVWRPSRTPKTHKRRRAVVPGYVFADLPPGYPLPHLEKLAGVWGAMLENGQVATVPMNFLRGMLLAELFGGLDHTVERKRDRGKRPDAKGQQVRVSTGKWEGAAGEIIRAPRQDRAKVLVSVVKHGKTTSQKIDVPLDELELVE